MNARKLTLHDVEITVECLPEHIPIEGNCMASGDDAVDAECLAEILTQLDDGNAWAWCCVKVTARLGALVGVDYLGACSYKSKEDFCQPGGYFDDMKVAALADLQQKLDELEPFFENGGGQ